MLMLHLLLPNQIMQLQENLDNLISKKVSKACNLFFSLKIEQNANLDDDIKCTQT